MRKIDREKDRKNFLRRVDSKLLGEMPPHVGTTLGTVWGQPFEGVLQQELLEKTASWYGVPNRI